MDKMNTMTGAENRMSGENCAAGQMTGGNCTAVKMTSGSNAGGEFESFCRNLNRRCMQAQTRGREFVSEETAFEATVIVRSLVLKERGDVLLYGAALNVLNTYVKQDRNKRSFGYFFKKNADIVAKFLQENPDCGIVCDLQESWGMPYLLADICGVQCSFHGVTLAGDMLKLQEACRRPGHKALEWDGIRKQMCANTFFEGAKENKLERSDLSLTGNACTRDVDRLLTLYRAGAVTLSEVRRLNHPGTHVVGAFIAKVQ